METEIIVSAAVALVGAVAAAAWAWFKARAKQTPETWDDAVVDAVDESLAKRRVEQRRRASGE